MSKIRLKKIFHIDEKSLKPRDFNRTGMGTSPISSIKITEVEVKAKTEAEMKSIIGRPKIYDLKGNLLAEEENLVVLTGREFLAQLIANKIPANAVADSHCIANQANPPSTDYSGYRITHFGVGDGGATDNCPPEVLGPYDNDCNLVNSVKIGTPTGTDNNYIDGGYLKQIEFVKPDLTIEGSITIEQEEHTINTGDPVTGLPTGEIQVQAFTAIKFLMQINPGEPIEVPGQTNPKPFRFNEAGLFAVKYDSNGLVVPDPFDAAKASKVMFARFTTMDKWLDENDGILIEWYILV